MKPSSTVPLVGTYIGAAEYSAGVNPFVPIDPTPVPNNTATVVGGVLGAVGAIAFIIAGALCYK